MPKNAHFATDATWACEKIQMGTRPASTTITQILRMGTHVYKVSTACGHHYEIARAAFDRAQLYVGKRVTCDLCTKSKPR